jgi:hypothetical protein
MKKAKREGKRPRRKDSKGINIKISNRLINTVQQSQKKHRVSNRRAGTFSMPGFTPMNPFPNPGPQLVYGTSDSFSGLASGTQLASNTAKAIEYAQDKANDYGQSTPITGLRTGEAMMGTMDGRSISKANIRIKREDFMRAMDQAERSRGSNRRMKSEAPNTPFYSARSGSGSVSGARTGSGSDSGMPPLEFYTTSKRPPSVSASSSSSGSSSSRTATPEPRRGNRDRRQRIIFTPN